MDCQRLEISIPTVRNVYSGSTPVVMYGLHVKYGHLEWEAVHRFSDFLALAAKLEQQGICALPGPPAKQLGRISSSAQIEGRRLLLQTWLLALLERPDVRTSAVMQDFIEFVMHTGSSAPPLQPQLCGEGADSRFHVGDFAVLMPDTVLATYEEAATLARVGKVWSLVDAEHLGGVALWRLSDSAKTAANDASPPSSWYSYVRMLHMGTPHRARSLFYHPPTQRIFVAQENGTVLILGFPDASEAPQSTVPPTDDTAATFARRGVLPLHSEAVLSLNGSLYGNGLLLSVGFDNCVRVIDCTTLDPVAGGKLSRRLAVGEHLAVGQLDNITSPADAAAARLFVATSKGRIFVFTLNSRPPGHLTTIACDPPDFIAAMKLVNVSLVVAHGRTLSIFRVGPPQTFSPDSTPQRIASFSLDASSGRKIRAIAVARTAPLLFLGHSGGYVSVWDCHVSECVCAYRAHAGAAKRLEVIEDCDDETKNASLALVSAGSDGFIRLWRYGPSADYRLWSHPRREATKD